MLSEEKRVEASVGRVLAALEAEAALIPGSRVGEMLEDWAGILRGQPSPWVLPWSIAATRV